MSLDVRYFFLACFLVFLWQFSNLFFWCRSGLGCVSGGSVPRLWTPTAANDQPITARRQIPAAEAELDQQPAVDAQQCEQQQQLAPAAAAAVSGTAATAGPSHAAAARLLTLLLIAPAQQDWPPAQLGSQPTLPGTVPLTSTGTYGVLTVGIGVCWLQNVYSSPDPDPHRSACILVGWIRIRIGNTDPDPWGPKWPTKVKKIQVLQWFGRCFLLRDEETMRFRNTGLKELCLLADNRQKKIFLYWSWQSFGCVSSCVHKWIRIRYP